MSKNSIGVYRVPTSSAENHGNEKKKKCAARSRVSPTIRGAEENQAIDLVCTTMYIGRERRQRWVTKSTKEQRGESSLPGKLFGLACGAVSPFHPALFIARFELQCRVLSIYSFVRFSVPKLSRFYPSPTAAALGSPRRRNGLRLLLSLPCDGLSVCLVYSWSL